MEHYSIEYLTEKSGMTRYWSRAPGQFVNRDTGEKVICDDLIPAFRGTVREWYELLVEEIISLSISLPESVNDSNEFGLIPRKFRECKIYTTPDVATIIEQTVQYRACYKDDDIYKMGTITNRMDLYKSDLMKRNELYIVNNKGHVGKLEVVDMNII
jgi:hypothetical protein